METFEEEIKETLDTGIEETYIEDELKNSYLDYSMSVIVSRALPDVRDGLKPVHRRILFAMNELGMTSDKPYKKSARIVGEVLGKYHPHGDTAVYNSMVRMAQEFNFRYPIISGHGNFGSIDGDNAAAMRYTEARMAKITSELLLDIEKDTIDYQENFDASLKEPTVLPAKLPNLLLNGSSGIAVGMATNIPPHNITEIINGAVALIENKEITIEELMEYISGPDFPTGGIINGTNGIIEAYNTGRGKIRIRGSINIEVNKKTEQEAIIIKELPYQVNKARLIEKIANLVKDKKISGITDLRDESDRDGIRVYIEIKRGENTQVILNKLYKYTDLEVTFGIITLALVNNIPRVLNIKEVLENYIKHRLEVIIRRVTFDLNKSKARMHVLEGLKIALDNIDEIIKLIKASKDSKIAKDQLKEIFKLSEIQAKAILEMKLQRLTGLEREKIEEEYNQLLIKIKEFEEILANENLQYEIMKEELLELKKKYGDKRRTLIQEKQEHLDIEDLIKDEEVIVTITHTGYIKRMPIEHYKMQHRGGKGFTATSTQDKDFIENMHIASNLDTLLIFTNAGKLYKMKVYEIPSASKIARGKLIYNLIQIDKEEKVSAIIKIRNFEEPGNLLFITKKGIVKKTMLSLYKNVNKSGIRAITLKKGNDLIKVIKTNDESNVFLATQYGYAIRFKATDVKNTGRSASGVIGMRLREGDVIVGGEILDESETILTISENGYGKRTYLKYYKEQNRAGKGIINLKVTHKTGNVISVKAVNIEDEIMIITVSGKLIRTGVKNISTIGRATQGVKIMNITKDKATSVVKIVEKTT